MKKIATVSKNGWEISLIQFEDAKGVTKFKVTRRFSMFHIAETKVFTDYKKAEKQFREWSQ